MCYNKILMIQYLALLRGINVGGNKKVSMTALTLAFEAMNFGNVKTLLNTGNVIFKTRKMDPEFLAKKISKKLETEFGFSIKVIVRTMAEMEVIAKQNPFKNTAASHIRFYVTFLSKKTESRLKLPYRPSQGALHILKKTPFALFSVVDVNKSGSPEAMAIIEKEFGNNVTTRNWNTVLKILNLPSQ